MNLPDTMNLLEGKDNSKLCLYPLCATARHIRGLCRSHYTYASRLIKDKETTWDVLIENGKAMPASGPSGRGHGKVKKWFLEKGD